MKNSLAIMAAALLTALAVFAGCGKPATPLSEIRQTLKGVPTYSVILEDMKEEGSFVSTYFHKYRVVTGEKSTVTDWWEVPEDYYRQFSPFLGMTIFSRQDGKDSDAVGPPGYEYVGNPRYGSWRTDSSGRSFWVFYGQYRLFSDLLGFGRPIYRDNWSTYNNHRSRNTPYYGPNREYGTEGAATKQQKPNFYQRRMSTKNAKNASFSDRVSDRIGRTRTSTRGRGGGIGK